MKAIQSFVFPLLFSLTLVWYIYNHILSPLVSASLSLYPLCKMSPGNLHFWYYRGNNKSSCKILVYDYLGHQSAWTHFLFHSRIPHCIQSFSFLETYWKWKFLNFLVFGAHISLEAYWNILQHFRRSSVGICRMHFTWLSVVDLRKKILR